MADVPASTLLSEAISEAEARGYARGIEDAAKVAMYYGDRQGPRARRHATMIMFKIELLSPRTPVA